MANLKQLSEKLGLSQTTISRALNGYPEVSEATRRRVIEAAREHDYEPNSSARRLATGKSRTIGHVVPISHHDMINPHFTDFIAGAGAVYNRRGYDMLISVVDSAQEAATYRALKRNGRVDGIIVHAPIVRDPRPAMLRKLGLPFVVHGRTLDDEASYAWVDVNNCRAFREATQHLIGLGHRRIALVNGLEHMAFAQRRREGYESALREAGIAVDGTLMSSDEMIEPAGYEAMRRFLALAEPPTAVLCASALSALGVMGAAREDNLLPGTGISIICYDDCLSFLDIGPDGMGLTVMRSAIREAGEHCASMLIDRIEGRQTAGRILLEAKLIEGRSTARCRPAPGRRAAHKAPATPG
ncbi:MULTISPECIES: substrate-binding domain-containing protein [unclassified Roseitalea]|uniref:LacI family DNA-binding transcriptional regulator n=1 Tax=unclassified Roseitalea TaxID=2639107 RepID=UPI00273DDD85|nr:MULTISPECIES: substrate-binding domain-containing protein [unclassified Roseitalea]